MNNYNLITITRYISLFMIILNSFTNINHFSNYLFFLVLIFIINNQLRYFNLYNKKILASVSFVVELILIFLLSCYSTKQSIFYFIPLIIDITFFKHIINKSLYLFLILVSCFITTFNTSIYTSFEYTMVLSIISILCIYIYI